MIITVDEVNNKKKNYCTRQKEITKMKVKKFIAMMAVTAMVAGMATGCGGSNQMQDLIQQEVIQRQKA